MPLQRIHFSVKRRNLFRAIIIGEQLETKPLQHRRALLWSTLFRIEGNNAPRNQIGSRKQAIGNIRSTRFLPRQSCQRKYANEPRKN